MPVLKKMKATHVCITLLLIYSVGFFSVSAGAEGNRWALYYSGSDGTKYYYNSKSITRSSRGRITTRRRRSKILKRYRRIWHVKVKEKVIFNNPDDKLKESLISREFDCSKKKVRMLMKSESYKNGSTAVEGKMRPWEDVDSKPFYQHLYAIVCPSWGSFLLFFLYQTPCRDVRKTTCTQEYRVKIIVMFFDRK